MTQVRNESNAEISHMSAVRPEEKRSAIQSLGTVYTTEVRTLREHEEEALRRLREAERR